MHYSYLIKPASSLCNMNCTYCFYRDEASSRDVFSYGIMDTKTMQCLIDQCLKRSIEITFAFQGGEPTLAGLAYFESFVAYVNEHKQNHNIHYTIQTNGLLIDDKWLAFFKEHHFLVGLSMDGFKENHNSCRVQNNNMTFEKVEDVLRKLQENEIEYNVLTVLTSSLSKYPDKLYAFYKHYNIGYVQLIPCLPELGRKSSKYALTPKQFYFFYKKFYQLWASDMRKGNYMSVTLFDQLMLIFSGRAPSLCGLLGTCLLQYVIEANGNVYPCDFYCTDTYMMGNILEKTFDEMDGTLFLNEAKNTCLLCPDCKFKKICQGNCKRMNVTYFSKNYCGYQALLEDIYKDIYALVSK